MSTTQLETPIPWWHDTAAEAPPGPKVYDRSSMDGDFVVMIPGQTTEDFEEFAPESRFCEYFEGVVYMPSPVSDQHQEWTGFLYQMLDSFRWARPGLIKPVMTGPAVLRLDDEHKAEPDVFVRAAESRPGDPKALLVVEVLSPSNRAYDLAFKARFYRQAGIPEIWYIDGKRQLLVVDRRDGPDYTRVEYKTGRVAPASIPGFWIDAAWLWESSLPNPRECLEAVLASA